MRRRDERQQANLTFVYKVQFVCFFVTRLGSLNNIGIQK